MRRIAVFSVLMGRKVSFRTLVASLIALSCLFSLETGANAAIVPVSLTVEPNILGEQWRHEVSGGFFLDYFLRPLVDHRVTIVLSDGSIDVFELTVHPSMTDIDPIEITEVAYEPLPGTRGFLTAIDAESVVFVSNVFVHVSTTVELLDFDTGLPYDPQLYRYGHVDSTGEVTGVFDLAKGFSSATAVPEPSAIVL